MPNALTRHIGLNAGTWVLETLVKHYFDRLFEDRKDKVDAASSEGTSGELRRDELLYDEAFYIVKVCLKCFSYLTKTHNCLVFPRRVHLVSQPVP